MSHKKAIVFLGLSAVFALTHYVAVQNTLYWVFKWFDILMHFWGGGLIALGVHTLCSFSRLRCRPHLPLVVVSIISITVAWEVFEWFAGLYDPATYFLDTVKDVAVGFAGGLLAHTALSKRTIGE